MERVKPEDLLRYAFLSDVQISPACDAAGFIVRQAELENNAYRSSIYLASLAGEQRVFRLTHAGNDGPYAWEPGGRSIVFFSKEDREGEKGFLNRVDAEGGEPTVIAPLAHKPRKLLVLDDGRILYTARAAAEEGRASGKAEVCVALEEIPFWQNGEGITSGRRLRLYRMDPSENRCEVLSQDQLEVKDFDALGKAIVVLARRFDGKAPGTDELWLLEEGHPPRCLSKDELAMDAVRFLDRDHVVLLGTDMAHYGRGENREVLKVHCDSGERRSLTPGWDRSVGSSVMSDCRHGSGPAMCVTDGRVFVVVTERDTSFVGEVTSDGSFARTTAPGGSVDAFDIRGDVLVAVELHPDRLQELYRYRNGEPEQLSVLNERALAEHTLALPKPFRSISSDGTEIDAWLVRPSSLEEGKKCPWVLSIHGGPRAAFSAVFQHEMQCLAAAGYAVLYANPRGSSGRGNVFADLRGRYGTVDYEDLMAVVDTGLRRFPFLDPDRGGVMGGSYGGFMTNWIIGHTDRFRAAVSQRCIANWTSKFCTTDIGYLFNRDQLAADPWAPGGQDVLWDRSPLKYADRVSTPTLFIHAEQDYRCWLSEGIQMFTALQYHEVASRLVLFWRENHELSRTGRPEARLRRLREIIAWLNTHLGSP